MNKKLIFGIALIAFVIAGIIGLNFYQKIYGQNVIESGFIFLRTNATFDEHMKTLESYLEDEDDFVWVAEKKKFSKFKPGKYKIEKGMSNNDLINLLRSGNQTPIKVSFNNQNTLKDLAARIATQIEADSLSLLNAFTHKDFITENSINEDQVLGYFIPNTYEFYWNTSAEQFRDRMVKEFQKFWNSDRMKRAKELNMTPNEVITLASIVQKETAKNAEKATVAGLYLNRIKRGIPLQSDPTVIFAMKRKYGQDIVVKRVLTKDTRIKSPYNTYLNRGLPPSLIAMPDISSIDAVLKYQRHNYLYMCADPDKPGYHAFANTLKQHNKNARKYQTWLNKQGIMR